MTACPLCHHADSRPFITRESVPVHQNLLMADAGAARAATRGDLELRSCPACGFVWNSAFRSELLEYGQDYENTQTASPSFDRYVDSLVDALVADGVTGRDVVEVGCGKGYFLERLCERGGNRGTGFDPSYVGPDETQGGRVRYVREFYGSATSARSVEVVVCRHVIEHVPKPVSFLSQIRAALDQSPAAVVYFETPDLLWILAGTVIWDFFYEHCSYFTTGALRYAVEREGFRVTREASLFGGQYQWLEAVAEEAPVAAPRLPEASRVEQVVALARRYAREVPARFAALERRIESLAANGGVAVWGAGAKGVTLVNLCDPERRRVACVVDINPRKQGRFVPGTGHPIVAPEALAEKGIRHVIVMNPNYEQEVGMQAGAVDPMIRIHVADRL